MQRLKDLFIIILINFIWATQVPVIRMIGDRYGALTIAFVPMVISTLLFIPFLMAENKKRKVSRPFFSTLKHFIIPGITGVFLMQYLYTVGSTKTLAANAGIITLIIPVLVAVFATILLKEKINIVRIAGFLIAIAGVLWISAPEIKEASFTEGKYLAGNLIFLLACVCCGFYNTYCKLLVDKGYTELEILVYASIVACALCIPFLIWVEPFSLSAFFSAGPAAVWGMLELSLFVYGISMLLFFHVLKRMDITQAILGNYLLPFFIALLGLVLLKEKLTMNMVIGSVIIIVATMIVTVYEKRLLSLLKSNGRHTKVELK